MTLELFHDTDPRYLPWRVPVTPPLKLRNEDVLSGLYGRPLSETAEEPAMIYRRDPETGDWIREP